MVAGSDTVCSDRTKPRMIRSLRYATFPAANESILNHHLGASMGRILFLAIGIFCVLLGLQLFCIYEVTLNPVVAAKLQIESPKLTVADYFPYGLICAGIVMFYYGYKMQK